MSRASSSSVELFDKIEFQSFKGEENEISIEAWLLTFERVANMAKWSENDKRLMMNKYLRGSALEWYAYLSDDLSWLEIKSRMIKRFGVDTLQPAVACLHVVYNKNTGIRPYFEEKRKLGLLGKLPESTIVQYMIDGLPIALKSSFNMLEDVKTFEDFYKIACKAESYIKEKERSERAPRANRNTSYMKKKPPQPCRICAGLGYTNRYHWMSDCRNKNKVENNSNNNYRRSEASNSNREIVARNTSNANRTSTNARSNTLN